jgi:hypothetical protein
MTSPATRNASASPAPWGLVRHPATSLALPVPPGWRAVLDAGAPVVLAAPLAPAAPGERPPFRPNAVGAVERPRPELAAIADYAAASVTNLRMLLTGLHVIAVDVIDIAGHEARRALCGYRDGITAVASEYWWVIADGVATTLTTTCQVEQYMQISPVFENIAAGMAPATQPVTRAGR